MTRTVADRAVDEFLAAKEELEEFMKDDEIKEVLKELERLVNDYNAKLDTAVRSVKNQLTSSEQQKLVIKGIGAQKKLRRWYDVDHLASALPAGQADLILTERVTYDLDLQLLEQLMRQGEIDNAIVAEAYHEEEQNPSAMPGTPKPYYIPPVSVD